MELSKKTIGQRVKAVKLIDNKEVYAMAEKAGVIPSYETTQGMLASKVGDTGKVIGILLTDENNCVYVVFVERTNRRTFFVSQELEVIDDAAQQTTDSNVPEGLGV